MERKLAALTDVPDEVLMIIAKFVMDDETGGKEGIGGLEARLESLLPLSGASNQMRGASVGAVRAQIARVLRVSLPQTVGTGRPEGGI